MVTTMVLALAHPVPTTLQTVFTNVLGAIPVPDTYIPGKTPETEAIGIVDAPAVTAADVVPEAVLPVFVLEAMLECVVVEMVEDAVAPNPVVEVAEVEAQYVPAFVAE